MKKIFALGIIAFAALSVSSCAKDEVVSSLPEGNAIEFGTYLGRNVQSRAPQLTTDGTDGTALLDFGVFASYTKDAVWSNQTPNFMFNQKVARTSVGADWAYSPKKYWPTTQGDQISFWAYAPYETADNGIEVTSTNTATTTPTIEYSLTGDLSKLADFVTDVEMNVTKSASTDPDGATRTVNFGLRHELTRVGINAVLDKAIATETEVNITKIEFGGTDMATVATYQFASTGDDRGTWLPTTTSATLDVTSLMDVATTTVGTYSAAGVLLTGTTPVSLFGANDYLFLIPFENGITTENVTITVYYDIVTADAALNGGHSVSSAAKVITLPASANLLQQGKAYLFNLKFYMNEIVLTASVDEAWVDAGHDQNVDWNDDDL